MKEYSQENPFRILSLDGGGAKGFYTLGALREIEAMIGCPIHEKFDLIFGTSTGAIIAALLALGYSVNEVGKLYDEYVPKIMTKANKKSRSKALKDVGDLIFKDKKFDDMKTNVGIVGTRWMIERPIIFKSDIAQAHGRRATFSPGFGVSVSDAVQASCSAYPFFEIKTVKTDRGDFIEVIDGGYCANNPTLFAISDAIRAYKIKPENIRVLSIGVGVYPTPHISWFNIMRWLKQIPMVQLLQKMFDINTQSMDQLRHILYDDIITVRISDTFEQPDMATDMFEHDRRKLSILKQRGSESFAKCEADLRKILM